MNHLPEHPCSGNGGASVRRRKLVKLVPQSAGLLSNTPCGGELKSQAVLQAASTARLRSRYPEAGLTGNKRRRQADDRNDENDCHFRKVPIYYTIIFFIFFYFCICHKRKKEKKEGR
jgi:hypothetical protein